MFVEDKVEWTDSRWVWWGMLRWTIEPGIGHGGMRQDGQKVAGPQGGWWPGRAKQVPSGITQ